MKIFLSAVALVIAVQASAQQLIPHAYPDTVLSEPTVQHAYTFRESGTTVTDKAALRYGSVTALPLTITGSALTGQAAYDPTRPDVTGVKFVASSKAAAASTSQPGFEWNQPFSVEATISNLQAPRTGGAACYSLVSKMEGTNGCPQYGQNVNGWSLYLSWTGTITNICFEVIGSRTGSSYTFSQVCTAADFVNGYTYQIDAIWPGTGNPSGAKILVNSIAQTVNVNTANSGNFGGVGSTTVTAGGAGYANSFAVTYTGGGCSTQPTGTATASGGVVTSVSMGTTFGIGCSSPPTPVFTAGGGTGATGTTTLNGASLINTAALTVGDRASNYSTLTYTMSGASVYGSALSTASSMMHYASLDWYRSVLPAPPTTPLPVLIDNDHCTDCDGGVQTQILLRAQQMGYISIKGIVNTEYSPYGPQYVENWLARAGLSHIPVAAWQGGGLTGGLACNTVNANVTTAPTKLRAAYPSSTTLYRQILASYVAAGKKITLIEAGPMSSFAALLASPADGISGLTGRQLVAAGVSSIYMMLGDYPTGTENNCFVDGTACAAIFNLTTGVPTTVPIYLHGYTLGQFSGPTGTFLVYPATSLLPQMFTYMNGGSDVRATWDSMPALDILAPSLFTQSASGTNTISSGSNSWSSTPASGHYYATSNVSVFLLRALIASFLFSDVAAHPVK